MQLNGFILMVLYGVVVSFDCSAKEISYQQHIKPILDKKCVVCHACFDAPCQLVLTHAEGMSRGANKQPVYDGLRTVPVPPTRLFVDAQSNKTWREKGFFSVLPHGTSQSSATPKSILEHLLLLRGRDHLKPNSRLPPGTQIGLKRKNICPTPDEINQYENEFPHGGMPFAVTDLSDTERNTLLDWLRQGARFDTPPIRLSAAEKQAVRTWEQFLNRRGLREQLVNRWLYEHLFMAHLYFSELQSGLFFQMVRSRTPPGKPISLIATRRPNDDVGQRFFYRLQPVKDTIVYKSHITFALDSSLLARINSLFLADDWNIKRLPGYKDSDRSNPFQTFAPIPAYARYQFMLEHAEYFVRTYIRGPVCHGQIASDVIRDQFWVFFQDPKSDLYITSAEYRNQTTPFMDIAGVEQDLLEGGKTWFSVKKQYNRYSDLRQSAYEHSDRAGADLYDIWNGGGSNNNALLTVFRHYDNASVRQGLIGDYPLTVWWMDYPLFERGYYNLVVNFDVFGSIAHQAQTRFYFDLIRNDAERNFLRLMPANSRQALLDTWYEGVGQLKLMTSYQDISDKKSSGIHYKTRAPMLEFLDMLLKQLKNVNERPDTINRWHRTHPEQQRIKGMTTHINQTLSRIASKPARDLPAVKEFPETAFIRLFDNSGYNEIYTVIRNRMHTNVAFLFGESLRRKPEEDTLTIYPGILASYPNFIFNVPINQIDNFISALLAVNDKAGFEKDIIQRWGVRRTHRRFWNLFHELTAYLRIHSPIEAGIMDMSRYEDL